MDRFEVVSSNVKSLGHDPDSNLLEVEYKSGGIYHYWPVEEAQFDEMMVPGVSVGRLINAIKNNPFIEWSKADESVTA